MEDLTWSSLNAMLYAGVNQLTKADFPVKKEILF